MTIQARLAAAALTGLAASLLLGAAAVAAPAASASVASQAAAAQPAYVRLAHLSPDTPAMDVYLYPDGDVDPVLVLKHVSYGAVSGYQAVPGGTYTVAMRKAGAPPTSQAAITAGITVKAGTADTVAAVGPTATLQLKVINDQMTAPASGSLIRVIQASTSQPKVTVDAGSTVLGSNVAFAAVTPYKQVTPGAMTVRASAAGADGSAAVTLDAATAYSVLVLDKPGGLVLTTLTDSRGLTDVPSGGAQTGFGGTAPRPWGLLPRLGLGLAALLSAAGAALVLRRRRRPAVTEG